MIFSWIWIGGAFYAHCDIFTTGGFERKREDIAAHGSGCEESLGSQLLFHVLLLVLGFLWDLWGFGFG